MRVLVTAASKYGGTAGIAEAIGRRLEDHAGFEVDVVPVEEVEDLAGYDAVVLGSGVYAGRWLKHVRRFVDDNSAALVARPTWLFSSGPIGDPPKPDPEAAVKIDKIVAASGAREHRVFSGRLDPSSMSFGDRAVITAMRSPSGDFRDWEQIAAWADEIASALTPSVEIAAATG